MDLIEILNPMDWVILALYSMLIGGDKAGLRGINILTVPAFAFYFGGKLSVSIVMVLFLVGDFCAIFIYRNKISWRHLARLLPAALVGLTLGVIIGNLLPDKSFKLVLAIVVLFCLILMVIYEILKKNLKIPDHWAYHGTFGLTGGFTTMVGNASGPIMSLYLLSMKLPKDIYIGTGTVYFLVLNLLKVPVHAFIWHSIVPQSLLVDLYLAPFVLLGVFTGLKIVKKIPEQLFRMLIIIASFLATIRLFF